MILRWILSTEDSSGVVRSEDAYELFRPGEEVPSTGFYKIDLSRFYPKTTLWKCSVTGRWSQFNLQRVKFNEYQ